MKAEGGLKRFLSNLSIHHGGRAVETHGGVGDAGEDPAPVAGVHEDCCEQPERR